MTLTRLSAPPGGMPQEAGGGPLSALLTPPRPIPLAPPGMGPVGPQAPPGAPIGAPPIPGPGVVPNVAREAVNAVPPGGVAAENRAKLQRVMVELEQVSREEEQLGQAITSWGRPLKESEQRTIDSKQKVLTQRRETLKERANNLTAKNVEIKETEGPDGPRFSWFNRDTQETTHTDVRPPSKPETDIGKLQAERKRLQADPTANREALAAIDRELSQKGVIQPGSPEEKDLAAAVARGDQPAITRATRVLEAKLEAEGLKPQEIRQRIASARASEASSYATAAASRETVAEKRREAPLKLEKLEAETAKAKREAAEPAGKPLPAEEVDKLSGLESTLTQLREAGRLHKPEFTGFFQGPAGAKREKYDIARRPGETAFARSSPGSNTLLKARSGGAITPQEYERLRNELPTPNDPPGVFTDKLKGALASMDEIIENKRRSLGETGYRVPARSTASQDTGKPATGTDVAAAIPRRGRRSSQGAAA